MYLLKLKGSRWQIGYDYGVLLGQAMTENYHTLLTSVIPEEVLFFLQIFIVEYKLYIVGNYNVRVIFGLAMELLFKC